MLLQVLGQLADALGQDGDLNLGRAGVALVGGVVGDDLGLDFFGDHSGYTPFKKFYTLRLSHGRKGYRNGGMTPKPGTRAHTGL